jgi:hypothetical protein
VFRLHPNGLKQADRKAATMQVIRSSRPETSGRRTPSGELGLEPHRQGAPV